jgi:membrane-associated protease RseP (regulator of RpoE activity)
MLKKINPLVFQISLFILTVFTTTLVGASWVGISIPGESFWDYFSRGFAYSLPFLGILTVHELGHYFTAKYYKVDVTLPYYIPMYLPTELLFGASVIQIGTMGAFIRMNSRSSSKKEIFDIGIAGPLAGFFVAVGLLYYGFTNLPEQSYIFKVHPEYEKFGTHYADTVYTKGFHIQQTYELITKIKDSTERAEMLEVYKQHEEEPVEMFSLGHNLIFSFFEHYVVEDKSRIPNRYEMYHYPFILAGFLALFFTALNLLPIGQLDGGHVIYGLFGYKKHRIISRTIFLVLIYLGGVGIFRTNILQIDFFNSDAFNMIIFVILYLQLLYFMLEKSFTGFTNRMMFSVLIFASQFFTEYFFPAFNGLGGYIFVFCILIGRVIGTDHPIAKVEEPLDWKRKALGWFTLFVFVICFIPDVFPTSVLK